MPQVRVIGDDGEQLGIMNTRDAVLLARGKGLDLVEVAATADPPVCRIIDYGKFTYEAKKKASAEAGTEVSTKCAVCGSEFETRNALYKHLKEKKHAAPLQPT